MEEAREMLLRDALEEAIQQEKMIINQRRKIRWLCVALGITLAAMLYFAIV